MTNLYVSGTQLENYSTITTSSTLINADKITKNFKEINYTASLYLDENNNLYSDINGETLIDTNVDNILSSKAYFKDNKIYAYYNNIWQVVQDQVKEVLYISGNGVAFNDVNNRSRYITYDGTYNIVYNYYFKELNGDGNRTLALREDGVLCISSAIYYSNFSETSFTNVEHILNYISWGSSTVRYFWIVVNGKINKLTSRIGSGSGLTLNTENVLNFEDDEYLVKYLPTKTVSLYQGTSVYLLKTNKQTYTNNNNLNGLDIDFINYIDAKATNTAFITFFACTSIIEFDINFYKRDNETIETTTRTLPVNYTTITVDGTTATINLHTAIDTSKDVVYTIEKPKGLGFAGFTTQKGSVNVEIPLEGQITLINQEINLYPVYLPILPDDAVIAVLYNMTCERNKIDKTRYLTQYLQLKGIFRSAVDVENPLLTLQLDAYPAFNYVYLPFFNRYYFVVGVRNISKNIYEINLKVDVLYTYKEQIKNCLAEIIRSSISGKQNPYIIDNLQPLKNTNIITAFEIPNTVFNNDDQTWKNNFNYVLSVIRGLNLKSTHTFDVWQ